MLVLSGWYNSYKVGMFISFLHGNEIPWIAKLSPLEWSAMNRFCRQWPANSMGLRWSFMMSSISKKCKLQGGLCSASWHTRQWWRGHCHLDVLSVWLLWGIIIPSTSTSYPFISSQFNVHLGYMELAWLDYPHIPSPYFTETSHCCLCIPSDSSSLIKPLIHWTQLLLGSFNHFLAAWT